MKNAANKGEFELSARKKVSRSAFNTANKTLFIECTNTIFIHYKVLAHAGTDGINFI